ncbi:UDP glycosyltransferase 9 [Sesamum alatum]|uniref:Glycosyltransferase n=1 Tax=Sesamum alatum TaxID=300844 RepID=A0AAE1Y0F9_9LAMI|nr:UDP glycosyltransferase 9 [Sesamum alatum]
METQERATSTHILAIPFPLQGHMNPMVQLCNRLVPKGIHVTFVTTASICTSLQIQGGSNLMINVETVPDSAIDVVEDLDIYETFIRSFRAAISRGLPDIIMKKRNSSFPFKAVVYDSVIPWILDIVHENGLKGAVLFTQPCAVCSVFYHMHQGTLEIPPDEGSEISLPGMPVLRLKDLPSLVYDMSSYPTLLRLLVEQFSTFEKADWRLFNTFDRLEEEILKWMANKYPIRTIGPTVPSMYTDKRLLGNYDYGLSLFKPNTDSCMKWLDEKEDRSVIYVSFGSLADLADKQMKEVAWSLIDSKFSFLWVVRNTEESKLPKDFTSELHDNGLIVNWCSQLEVLSHRAVGCFLTHGGWNSTMEALSLGVPMVAMPLWVDQTTNAKLVADVWQIGVRVEADENGIVTREEIAARVKDVMQGERGLEIRRNAVKWKDMAIEAISEGGSSDKNFTEFAMELLST